MKIVNLADDLKSTNDLLHEHGLSFYIETKSNKYLFDTGASNSFIHNANRLGINLQDIDSLFISHNHYDHIGGLLYFMEINKKAKIYIKQDALYDTFYVQKGIRCPLGKYHKEIAENKRIVLVEKNMKVDDFYLMSDTNGNRDYFSQGSKFFMNKNRKIISDDFSHEMFLTFILDDKVNIISGCSHRGIINIIETVKRSINLPINTVIGGLHLSSNGGTAINCSDDYYNLLVGYLQKSDISTLYTCHCTGKYGYELLKNDLGNSIEYFHLGNIINL